LLPIIIVINITKVLKRKCLVQSTVYGCEPSTNSIVTVGTLYTLEATKQFILLFYKVVLSDL
jgi:hypothetical protein